MTAYRWSACLAPLAGTPTDDWGLRDNAPLLAPGDEQTPVGVVTHLTASDGMLRAFGTVTDHALAARMHNRELRPAVALADAPVQHTAVRAGRATVAAIKLTDEPTWPDANFVLHTGPFADTDPPSNGGSP